MIWETISECESYLVGEGNKVVRPVFFGKGLDKVEEIQQAAQTIRQEWKSIDARLAQSNWLVGGQISAADITVFPLVQLLLRAASKEAARPLNLGLIPLSQTYPNLARWVGKLKPCPATSVPIHRTGDHKSDRRFGDRGDHMHHQAALLTQFFLVFSRYLRRKATPRNAPGSLSVIPAPDRPALDCGWQRTSALSTNTASNPVLFSFLRVRSWFRR